MKKAVMLLSLGFLTMSCATSYIHSSPSDYVDSGKPVNITEKNVNFLGFSPIDVHQVSGSLLKSMNKKCGGSGVENIRTTVSITPYPFLTVEKMHASGTCKK